MKHQQIATNGLSLHFVEHGRGPAVLFCHGFPAIWSSWRAQMEAVADAGYLAIAPDMRGYGRTDAPDEAEAYTPFHTVGDLVGVLDHLGVEDAVLVGHDFGANVAWNAAMMRPDRFRAVFGISVPYLQPGNISFLDQLRKGGLTDFYMFGQIRPEADQEWADAATTIPGMLYWTSGRAPEAGRWNPFDPARNMRRAAPEPLSWIDGRDLAEAVTAFERTGFHGALNYYRAIDLFSAASGAFAGAVIAQPTYFLTGSLDGVNSFRTPDEGEMRKVLPGLRGFTILDGIGHWPQLEAPEAVNAALLQFLDGTEHTLRTRPASCRAGSSG